MKLLHGFLLVGQQEIPELRIAASLYRHDKTGAELLSLQVDDPNKVFCITFRTPLSDSTGVPHILEHAVLCGSRKYPLKEPFVELLKGSLNTFLNACTYPDRTCYPVASQNLRDFYNLIDVYCDAVFYPLLKPVVFRQEGWHYALEGQKSGLSYKGVVFNEMKGAYSSAESLLFQQCQASLFPDTPYRFDAGGDPEQIPSLTYQRFVEFHKTYYHPSNSMIFFYGDDNPQERLRLMNLWLQDFERRDIPAQIPRQPLKYHPQKIVKPFPSGSSSRAAAKGIAGVNWLLPGDKDPDSALAWSVLEHILLGMPASPLRKALLDSGLGEGIAGVGLEIDLAQLYFSVGLKGVEVQRLDEVEPLVLESLRAIIREGIDDRTRAASLNTIEFKLRENNSGRFPRGLMLLLRALTIWPYGGNPCDMIAFAAPLERLHHRLQSMPRLFEDMIERMLLENLHRTSVLLTPDPDLAKKQTEQEQERLNRFCQGLTESQREAIAAQAREVEEWQRTPDPPEARAALPHLMRGDLDRHNMLIPCTCFETGGARILFHDIFTSGICYIDIGLNLHVLQQDRLACVPLLGRALIESGTAREDFVQLSQHIGQATGGIKSQTFASAINKSRDGSVWLLLRGKALYRQVPELLSILADVLLTARLDDRERIRQLVAEEKAAWEQRLIPHGHQVVASRLRARFHVADWADEQMNGCSCLLFLREYERHDNRLCSMLEEIRERIVTRNGMIVNVTADADGWKDIEPQVNEFINKIPDHRVAPVAWHVQPVPEEALCVPSLVNFVGAAVNLYEHGHIYHGSLQVAVHLVRTNWLWEQVRLRGGAYGALCSFDSMSGTLLFVSYRDPRLLETLEVFKGTAHFLRAVAHDAEQIERSIIGTIGDIDQPLLPDMRGLVSMQRFLNGNTDALRQKMRDEILTTGPEDILMCALMLEDVLREAAVTVLGPAEKLREANSSLCGILKEQTLL